MPPSPLGKAISVVLSVSLFKTFCHSKLTTKLQFIACLISGIELTILANFKPEEQGAGQSPAFLHICSYDFSLFKQVCKDSVTFAVLRLLGLTVSLKNTVAAVTYFL